MRWPPHWPDYENFFTGDFIWKGACFAIFQQELQNSTMFDGLLRFQISEKWAHLRFPLNIQKQKVFQLQGGFAPWFPDRGLCPWTPLGPLPPDPRYRLALRALAMAPLPNPEYATGESGERIEWASFVFISICFDFQKKFWKSKRIEKRLNLLWREIHGIPIPGLRACVHQYI